MENGGESHKELIIAFDMYFFMSRMDLTTDDDHVDDGIFKIRVFI